MNGKLKELSGCLEKDIHEYDKVLLFETEEGFQEFCATSITWDEGRRLLILSSGSVPPGKTYTELKNVDFRQVSEADIDLLAHLYYTYEFSDQFILIPKRNTNYPNLYHFVDSGVLSREEVFGILMR